MFGIIISKLFNSAVAAMLVVSFIRSLYLQEWIFAFIYLTILFSIATLSKVGEQQEKLQQIRDKYGKKEK